MPEVNLDSWEGLVANPFLNAENIDGNSAPFAVVSSEIVKKIDDDRHTVSLIVERNKEKFRFDLNMTNLKFLRNEGIKNPRAIIGKVICIKKLAVINPQTGKEVQGLRIYKIEA
jgi:hypothetical protein